MRQQRIFVTVDAVVFKKSANGPELLLIQRKNEPFKNAWALPGGFVDDGEDLGDAAVRELQEETGIVATFDSQLGAFGKPGRDPRGHTISVAYLFFADKNTEAKAADDAKDARWFPTDKLPALAFDHAEIIDLALSKLD